MASITATSASSFLQSTKLRLISSSSSKTSSCRPVRSRIVCYMERDPNSAASIAGKVIGSLPLVGLFARIFNDEGGIGGDIIDFAEFRRRVGKNCGISDSRAFYEFQDRRGRVRLFSSLSLRITSFFQWLNQWNGVAKQHFIPPFLKAVVFL